MTPPGESEIDTVKSCTARNTWLIPFCKARTKTYLCDWQETMYSPVSLKISSSFRCLFDVKNSHKYHHHLWKGEERAGGKATTFGTWASHGILASGYKQYVCHIWILFCTQTHTQSSLSLKFCLTVLLPLSAMSERSVTVRCEWSKIMAGNIALGIKEVQHEHSGDESDDDVDDVVEQSPCGRWEKRRQEVC